ncbi:hypothetical protein ACH47B_17700 [Rhodococcus sp. NPDC019627]|uniref:hypothetical protein n=1 Tax=unclassified Rhodococcus (in: high G+C Gram-positive bacteria) TaxID=192944 RepID=UPI00340B125C
MRLPCEAPLHLRCPCLNLGSGADNWLVANSTAGTVAIRAKVATIEQSRQRSSVLTQSRDCRAADLI